MVASLAPHLPLTAADAMSTPVVTVADTGTVWQAWQLVYSHGIRHVVVLHGDHCVGVVSDRELIDQWQRGPHEVQTMPVRRLLHDRTSCVLPDAALKDVARLMNQQRIDAVPVLDQSGELLGLITAGDILHAVAVAGVAVDRNASPVGAGDHDDHR